ncbi:MAG: hypothetical protein AB7S38_19650 [Vulcanimicrobiota bacterium]
MTTIGKLDPSHLTTLLLLGALAVGLSQGQSGTEGFLAFYYLVAAQAIRSGLRADSGRRQSVDQLAWRAAGPRALEASLLAPVLVCYRPEPKECCRDWVSTFDSPAQFRLWMFTIWLALLVLPVLVSYLTVAVGVGPALALSLAVAGMPPLIAMLAIPLARRLALMRRVVAAVCRLPTFLWRVYRTGRT